MTSAVGKLAARKIMKKTFKEYKDKEPAGEWVRIFNSTQIKMT
jgi:hypothetical protein